MDDSSHIDLWMDAVREHAFSVPVGYTTSVRAGSSHIHVSAQNASDTVRLTDAFAPTGSDAEPDLAITIVNGLPDHLIRRIPGGELHLGMRGRITNSLRAGRHMTIDPATFDTSMYFPDHRQAVWLKPHETQEWHYSSPFRQIIHSHNAQHGRSIIHAALIANECGAVLLTGSSFAGKSTASAFALQAGFKSGGDDYVELDVTDGDPSLVPIYRLVKIRTDARVKTDIDVQTTAELPQHGKKLHYLDPLKQMVSYDGTSIAALVALTPKHGSALKPITPAQALCSIAPSTLLQSCYAESLTMRNLATLCHHVPTYSMPRAQDASHLAKMLESILGGETP